MPTTRQIHAFNPDVLGDMDGVAVAEAIRRGDVSVKEVTDAAIARAEQVNPELNAIALRTYDQARAWATPAPGSATHAQGAFAGVPTFIKDNVDLEGFPTQFGSRIFKSAKARRTDPFTQQMLAQGFNVIGKTNLPEFGFNGSTEYQDGTATANPWHTGYSAGGSSGGSAALVAAGVVPIAHGNDGGGSIRIPAAACGLVGLKVSRNRFVNAAQSRTLPLNLISEGVLTRSVRDTAKFLAEAEKTFHNRRYPRVGLVEGPGKKRLKIGLLLSTADVPIDADTQTAVMHTARLLGGAGHTVVPIQANLTQDYIDAFLYYWGLLSFAVGRFGRPMFRGSDWDMTQYQGLSLELMRTFQRRWHRFPSALIALRNVARLNEAQFAPFDAVLSPVVTQASPELGYLSPHRCPPEQLLHRLTGYVGFTPMQNVLGTPAISLPMGMTCRDHRPIGIQLAAQAGQESTLLSLAFELETQVDFPRIEASR